jgi:uncharacterized protein YrrD
MLTLSSKLNSTPVMSLQTGSQLATIYKPLIDPVDLKIAAFYIDERFDKKQTQKLLMVRDIREFGPMGMIVDSSDEFIEKDDVINVKKLIDINFNLIGLEVIDDRKKKIGKVADYTVDSNDFVIWQLHITHGIFKSISSAGLIIGRKQIIEVNDTQVIVKSPDERVKSNAKFENKAFINPFATNTAQSEPADS